jgi:hypothetical protein
MLWHRLLQNFTGPDLSLDGGTVKEEPQK